MTTKAGVHCYEALTRRGKRKPGIEVKAMVQQLPESYLEDIETDISRAKAYGQSLKVDTCH